jgi:hypothetical protein
MSLQLKVFNIRANQANLISLHSYECCEGRNKQTLRLFENRVLRRISGRKMEEVAGGWRRLHNEELHNLYASPNIIRVIMLRRVRWRKHIECMEEIRNLYKVLVGKPEEKRVLGRRRRRWKDNIRMDFRETGCERVDRMLVANDRDQWRAPVNTIINLRFPQKATA